MEVINIITIYDSKCVDFNNNGLAVLSDAISCTITEELNKDYSLELEYPVDTQNKYLNIQGLNIIKAGDKGQFFRIPIQENIQNNGSSVKVSASHIFYDLNNDYIEDSRAENKSVHDALQIALSVNPLFTVGACSDLGPSTAYFVSESPTSSIYNKIISRWGGELYRDNYTVAIKNRIGADNGISVSYGKNLMGLVQRLDYSKLATRIKPIGKDGITIESVNGGSKYLISPIAGDYPNIITKEVKFDNIADVTELKNSGLGLWGYIDKVICNYSVNFADLSKTEEYKEFKDLLKLSLGDTVTIKHKTFNVSITARVIKLKTNIITNEITEMELGQFKNTTAINSVIVDKKIQNNETKIVEVKAAVVVVTADVVKNTADIVTTNNAIVLQATAVHSLDDRVASAELKITPEAITSTVTNSTTYINAMGQKITATQASTIAQTPSNVMIGFNGISNVIDIDSTGLQVNHTNGNYTHMGADGFKRHTAQGDKDYNYLTESGFGIGVQRGNTTITLPAEFQNKAFKISVGVSTLEQTGTADSTTALRGFACFVNNINYAAGTFTVYCRWEYTQQSDAFAMQFMYIATA